VAAQGDMLKLGAGAVSLKPRGNDAAVPRAPFRTEAMLKRAAPTNQWYSSLIFNDPQAREHLRAAAQREGHAGGAGGGAAEGSRAHRAQDVEIHYPHQDR
jgi:hypothetical protein